MKIINKDRVVAFVISVYLIIMMLLLALTNIKHLSVYGSVFFIVIMGILCVAKTKSITFNKWLNQS